MNAKVNIEVGVTSKERLNYERFRPSQTYTHSFNYVTDLDHYKNLTSTISQVAFDYVQSEYGRGILEMEIHVAVTLENITAPASGAGVIPRAKARVDSSLSDIEFTSIQVLQLHLEEQIESLQTIAKY